MKIGGTRSGRDVTEPGIDDDLELFVQGLIVDWTDDELFDASTVYGFHALRERRQWRQETDRYAILEELQFKIDSHLNEKGVYFQCRLNAGIKGLADMVRHARALTGLED